MVIALIILVVFLPTVAFLVWDQRRPRARAWTQEDIDAALKAIRDLPETESV